MGGLDLCYGRWDTNQHAIADCHPSNLEDVVFPGQDYNNARIMDFQEVNKWQDNKLDRKESSRMGWTDISLSLTGPVVEDLRDHFVQRWNFIYNEKYDVRKETRYAKLSKSEPYQGSSNETFSPTEQSQSQSGSGQFPPPPQGPPPSNENQAPYYPPPPTGRGVEDGAEETHRGLFGRSGSKDYREQLEQQARGLGRDLRSRFDEKTQHLQERYGRTSEDTHTGGIPCQIVRSSAKWSHGIQTEHSIANAYIKIIEESQHFIYIENQFFITATNDKQSPVTNKVRSSNHALIPSNNIHQRQPSVSRSSKITDDTYQQIGKAMVDRILRAARAGEKYKMFIIIPAVPGFAGDLKDDASLGTRAIMEFQYFSINRGGYSIMESIAKEGFEPSDYIRFYNLRNYDRINVGSDMQRAELESGVSYGAAQQAYDTAVELPSSNYQRGLPGQSDYQQYQQGATAKSQADGSPGRWDSVSECYMLNGPDIRSIPWTNGNLNEMDAFVSEELYVHSKVLIADDRVVICGSANLNDRSQLGDHDSEIAIIVEDPEQVDSMMNGQSYRAARFAATLRRQLFRKHLGLVPVQHIDRHEQNFDPVWVAPQFYDFDSPEDRIVRDPLGDTFLNFWNSRAKINTDVFSKVFHPVPDDNVRTWKDYDNFYEQFFKGGEKAKEGEKAPPPSKYKWGHVVAEEFAPGEEGVRQVKEELSKVKGTLVEMPLMFLIKEDIAVEGMGLNAFTEEVYT